jgi:hypothetical protein
MYAFALLQGGTTRPELTAWPATAMSFGLFEDEPGVQGAAAQAGSALITDWGARSLAATSGLFDPLHYNNGTVWPFVTGFSALAQYRYRNPIAGFQLLRQIVATGSVKGLGRNPEVFSGTQFEPLETAVPQQFFGTSFIPTIVVRGLLGWEPDAAGATVRLAPQLPPEWDSLAVANLAIGDRRYDVRFSRGPGVLRLSVHRSRGGAVTDTLVFAPYLPPGARVTTKDAKASGVLPSPPPVEGARETVVESRLVLGADAEVVVAYQPGYEILLPGQVAERGGRSRGVRVVDLRRVGDSVVVLLDGPAGTSANLRVRRGTEREVTVRFPDPGDRVDGYSRAELRLGP